MYSERDPPCETDSQSDALDGKCVQLNVTVEFGSIIDIIIDIVILTHSVIVITVGKSFRTVNRFCEFRYLTYLQTNPDDCRLF